MNTTTGTIKQLKFWGEKSLGKSLVFFLYGNNLEEEILFANELELSILDKFPNMEVFIQSSLEEFEFLLSNNIFPPDCVIVRGIKKELNTQLKTYLDKFFYTYRIKLPTNLEFDFDFSGENLNYTPDMTSHILDSIMKGDDLDE